MRKENDKRVINKKTGISFIALLVFIAMVITSINACGYFGIGNTMSWKEEVLLHDGSKLVVKRIFHLGSKATFDSTERSAIDETITFTLPGSNKKIIWKVDFRDSKPEPSGLNLLVLDIVNGTPYIATYPAQCRAYNKWERPNPPYIFLKYDGNVWKQISLAEFPPEINKVNVIVGRPPAKLKKSFYTVEQVKEQNRDIHDEVYKTILRTPLKPGSYGIDCPEWVFDGRKWMDIGFFNTKASYEECFNECKEVMFDIKYCPCNRLFKAKTKEK
jgi:uncharacterized protein (UPF0333 family)